MHSSPILYCKYIQRNAPARRAGPDPMLPRLVFCIRRSMSSGPYVSGIASSASKPGRISRPAVAVKTWLRDSRATDGKGSNSYIMDKATSRCCTPQPDGSWSPLASSVTQTSRGADSGELVSMPDGSPPRRIPRALGHLHLGKSQLVPACPKTKLSLPLCASFFLSPEFLWLITSFSGAVAFGLPGYCCLDAPCLKLVISLRTSSTPASHS